jgi:hypothetical protein
VLFAVDLLLVVNSSTIGIYIPFTLLPSSPIRTEEQEFLALSAGEELTQVESEKMASKMDLFTSGSGHCARDTQRYWTETELLWLTCYDFR